MRDRSDVGPQSWQVRGQRQCLANHPYSTIAKKMANTRGEAMLAEPAIVSQQSEDHADINGKPKSAQVPTQVSFDDDDESTSCMSSCVSPTTVLTRTSRAKSQRRGSAPRPMNVPKKKGPTQQQVDLWKEETRQKLASDDKKDAIMLSMAMSCRSSRKLTVWERLVTPFFVATRAINANPFQFVVSTANPSVVTIPTNKLHHNSWKIPQRCNLPPFMDTCLREAHSIVTTRYKKRSRSIEEGTDFFGIELGRMAPFGSHEDLRKCMNFTTNTLHQLWHAQTGSEREDKQLDVVRWMKDHLSHISQEGDFEKAWKARVDSEMEKKFLSVKGHSTSHFNYGNWRRSSKQSTRRKRKPSSAGKQEPPKKKGRKKSAPDKEEDPTNTEDPTNGSRVTNAVEAASPSMATEPAVESRRTTSGKAVAQSSEKEKEKEKEKDVVCDEEMESDGNDSGSDDDEDLEEEEDLESEAEDAGVVGVDKITSDLITTHSSWIGGSMANSRGLLAAAKRGLKSESVMETHRHCHSKTLNCGERVSYSVPARLNDQHNKQKHTDGGDGFVDAGKDAIKCISMFLTACEAADLVPPRWRWDHKLFSEMGILESSDMEKKNMAMLVCLVLSAATKDELCISATAELHRKGLLDWEELKKRNNCGRVKGAIKNCGIYKKKARFLRRIAKEIIGRFKGDTPTSVEDLTSMKGIGRKTATLYLNEALGFYAGIGVDSHVREVAIALGLLEKRGGKYPDADQTEASLRTWVPDHWYQRINRLFGSLGQMLSQDVDCVAVEKMTLAAQCFHRESDVQLLWTIVSLVRKRYAAQPTK